jgi:hypothetical protein
VTNLSRWGIAPNLHDIDYPGAEKPLFHTAKGGDVMRSLADALDISTIFSLVVLALYAFVLGFVFL